MASLLFLECFWLMLLLNFRRFLNPLRLAMLLAWVFVVGVLSAQAQTPTQLLGNAKVSNVVQTQQVKASLLALAPQGIEAGQTIWLGLELQHQPHWHTYWRNPGDSGLPTELTWKLPAGVSASPLIWPAPKMIPIGPMANFGYEDTVLLVTPLQIDKGFFYLLRSGLGFLKAQNIRIHFVDRIQKSFFNRSTNAINIERYDFHFLSID